MKTAMPHSTKARNLDPIKVKRESDINSIAGAIAHRIRNHGRAEVQVVGAGALNQAIKAIIVMRRFKDIEALAIVFYPAFISTEIDGQEKTAIKLFVEPRKKS